MPDVNVSAARHNVRYGFFSSKSTVGTEIICCKIKLVLSLILYNFANVVGKIFDEVINTVFQ